MLNRLFHRHSGRRFSRDTDWMGHGPRLGMHHSGGGPRRPFDYGDLRLVILQLITEKPRYGYDVIKAIEEKVGGGYSPSPGVIYPTLTMLEEMGHATVAAADGTKKLYTITEQGTAFLDANRQVVEAITSRLAKLQATQRGGSAPQILRAKENLKLALHLRLTAGSLSDERLKEIAQILDEAAGKIEQA